MALHKTSSALISPSYCTQKEKPDTSTALRDDLKTVEDCLGAFAKGNEDYARSIPLGMHPRHQHIVLHLLVRWTGMEMGDSEIANVVELAGTVL